jgi:hypothetical protein
MKARKVVKRIKRARGRARPRVLKEAAKEPQQQEERIETGTPRFNISVIKSVRPEPIPSADDIERFVEYIALAGEEGVTMAKMCGQGNEKGCDPILRMVPIRALLNAAAKAGHHINAEEVVPTETVHLKSYSGARRTIEMKGQAQYVFRYDFTKGVLDMAKTQAKAAAKKVEVAKEKVRTHKGREGAAVPHFPTKLDIATASTKDLIAEVRKDIEYRIKSMSGRRIGMGKDVAEMLVGYLKAAEAKVK